MCMRLSKIPRLYSQAVCCPGQTCFLFACFEITVMCTLQAELEELGVVNEEVTGENASEFESEAAVSHQQADDSTSSNGANGGSGNDIHDRTSHNIGRGSSAGSQQARPCSARPGSARPQSRGSFRAPKATSALAQMSQGLGNTTPHANGHAAPPSPSGSSASRGSSHASSRARSNATAAAAAPPQTPPSGSRPSSRPPSSSSSPYLQPVSSQQQARAQQQQQQSILSNSMSGSGSLIHQLSASRLSPSSSFTKHALHQQQGVNGGLPSSSSRPGSVASLGPLPRSGACCSSRAGVLLLCCQLPGVLNNTCL